MDVWFLLKEMKMHSEGRRKGYKDENGKNKLEVVEKLDTSFVINNNRSDVGRECKICSRHKKGFRS